MKRFVFFFICMVQVMFSYAQYCCTQKGQKFYYNVQYDGKLTETYASVVNVENSNSSYIITMGNPLPAMNEQLKDTLLYKKIVYSQDNTLVYLQDKDNEEANIYSMLSGIMDEKDIDFSLKATSKDFPSDKNCYCNCVFSKTELWFYLPLALTILLVVGFI